MTDKEIDKLVKQKLAQQTFEYNDAYWQKAAALIDADRANLNKLVWIKYAFYIGAIGIFGLMGWFLLSNNKPDKNNQKAENVVESNDAIQPNKLEEKKADLNKKSAPKSLNTNIENITLDNKKAFAKNNYAIINENLSIEQTEIFKNIDEEIEFINLKTIHLLGVELNNPNFDYKNINYIKSPNNYHKNKGILTYFNASFEVGINSFNQSFATNSLGYYLGGRLYFDIGKLSFNSNIHFENINQNLAARTYTNKVYDFNSNTETTTIKNKSIDYAIIGLNAMYPIYKNHSFGVGVQYAQLIQSNDLLSIYNVENNININKNTNDYSSILNKNDWQLTFSYQNRFTKHFAVNATYVFGLNDISKNYALAINKGNNNTGFKLGLQYIIK